MKEKGFVPLLILVGVLILVAVGSGAYYLGTVKNKPSNQNQVVTSQTNPSPIVQRAQLTPSPSPDETANWKEYRDEILKFSIKYPDDLVEIDHLIPGADTEQGIYAAFILIKEANEARINLEKRPKDDPSRAWDPGTGAVKIVLKIFNRGAAGGKKTNVPTRLIDVECAQPCDERTEEVRINNANGVRPLGPHYPYKDFYYLTNESRDIVVRINIDKDSQKYSDDSPEIILFRRMIDTFKFL